MHLAFEILKIEMLNESKIFLIEQNQVNPYLLSIYVEDEGRCLLGNHCLQSICMQDEIQTKMLNTGEYCRAVYVSAYYSVFRVCTDPLTH